MRVGRRNVDLISNALPFGRLWHTKPKEAIEYAKFTAGRMMLSSAFAMPAPQIPVSTCNAG